jgi:hypothetical protein
MNMMGALLWMVNMALARLCMNHCFVPLHVDASGFTRTVEMVST